MITIERVDPAVRRDVERFVDLPHRLHAGQPAWVPPLRSDERLRLDRRRHPFYDHSDAEFFVALRDGRVVGRIAALENRPFNAYHGTHDAHFYLWEQEDDGAVAAALFDRVADWAAARGLQGMVGPMGFGPLDGHGVLVEGFEHRQTMSMMTWNPPSIARLIVGQGFEPVIDFVSFHLTRADVPVLSERVRRIAERAERQGWLRVKRFRDKAELRAWAPRIGVAYNRAFVRNWEYYPLTVREVDFVLEAVMLVADPGLIKVILHGDEVVGFVLAFADVSAGLQRARGRLLPFGIVRVLRDQRRTRWLALNGAGILPEYQGHGGNALLYLELERTLLNSRFDDADITQNADTATTMRHDIVTLGAVPYKRHRVYRRAVERPWGAVA